MKAHLGISIIAAVMMAAGLGGAPPAQASVNVAVVIPGGVAFDVSTGGYCDRWGCPVAYWGYPVWYGPTYCGGVWYQGPAYYQSWNGVRYYWVHGGWCPNQWAGPYPAWWSSSFYYGPVLSFTWYESNGFRISSSSYAYWRSNGGARANWTTIAHQQFTTAATQGRIAKARPVRATSTRAVAPRAATKVERSRGTTRAVTSPTRSRTTHAVRERTSKGSATTRAGQRTPKGSAITKASQRTTGPHRSGVSRESGGPRGVEKGALRPDRGGPETRGPGPDREGGPDRGGHRGGPHG